MSQEEYQDKSFALNEAFDSDVRPLLDFIDFVRSFCQVQSINLPQLVVLGDQSSGKSSLLEAISHTKLPKKSGMATRCPLVIQMRKSEENYGAELSYFSKTKKSKVEKYITDPDKIEQAILEAQDAVTLNQHEISSDEITLKISSPTSPDLTLVDLPGLIRVADADSSEDTPKKIENLVRKYIQKDETIILCVVSGDVDNQMNESLKLALEADPEGRRTLGVITKPDLIKKDDRNNKKDLLLNKFKKLQNGYSLIYCRSFDDIQDKMTLEEALTREEKFLKSNEMMQELSSDVKRSLGTRALTRKLVALLKESIETRLKTIETKLETELTRIKSELGSSSDFPPEEKTKRIQYFMTVRYKLHERFKQFLIQGVHKTDCDNTFSEWREIYQKTFDKLQEMTQEFIRSNDVQKLKEYIKKHRGEELSYMDTFENLKRLLTSHFEKYKPEVKKCAESVKESLECKLIEIAEEELKSFPQLQSKVKLVIGEVLAEQSKKLTLWIEDYFEAENLVFVVVDDPNYVSLTPTSPPKQSEFQERNYVTVFVLFLILLYKLYTASYFEYFKWVGFLLMGSYCWPIISFFKLPTLLMLLLKHPYNAIRQILNKTDYVAATNAEKLNSTLKIYLQTADQRIGNNIPSFIRLFLNNKTVNNLGKKIEDLILKDDQSTEVSKMDSEEQAHRKSLSDQSRLLENALNRTKFLI